MGWREKKKVGEDLGFYTTVVMLTNGQVSATNLAWQNVLGFSFCHSVRFFSPDPSVHTTPDL